MKKILTAMAVSMALLTPVCVNAQDHDRDEHQNKRYYDKRHKDYHEWNANEDRAYHMYWEQRHHAYVDWEHASERQREAYWDWRHNHSDAVLQINIH